MAGASDPQLPPPSPPTLMAPTPPLSASASSASPLSSSSPGPSTPQPLIHGAMVDSLFASVQASGVKVKLVLDGDSLVLRKVRPGQQQLKGTTPAASSDVLLSSKPLLTIPTLHVLSHTLSSSPATSTSPATHLLRINYISTKRPKHDLTQLRLVLLGSTPLETTAEPFLANLTRAAYPTTDVRRRILLIVNPFGGKAGAVKATEKIVMPILEAAGCEDVKVVHTTRGKHGLEIARDMDLNAHDVIGVISGDGVVHEVFNGLASRKDAKRALRVPVVPVPAGSANSLSISLHGAVDGFSIAFATLNLIKGIPMKLDLCSVEQGSKPTLWSFLSSTVGMTAEVDLGTDHLRWMGDARFTYGVLKKTLELPVWEGTIYLKLDPSASAAVPGPDGRPKTSKAILANALRARLPSAKNVKSNGSTQDSVDPEEDGPIALDSEANATSPWLTGSDWIRFESGRTDKAAIDGRPKRKEDLLYAYAGNMALMSRDFLAFPFSAPGEGAMDVVVQEITSRVTIAKNFAGAVDGSPALDPTAKYYKATALHIIPSPDHPQQLISIDGEAISSADGPFTVTCLPGLARTLALHGRWEGGDAFWEGADGAKRIEKGCKLVDEY